MTRSPAVADWQTEFQRRPALFLGRLGHKARQRWLPVYVRGQMSATCAGAVRDRARVRGGRHGGALPPPTLHETAPHRCGAFSSLAGGSRPAIRLRLGLGKTAALPQTRQWSVLISKARRLRRTALPRSVSGRGFSSSMFVSLTSLTGTRNVMRTAVAVLSAS